MIKGLQSLRTEYAAAFEQSHTGEVTDDWFRWHMLQHSEAEYQAALSAFFAGGTNAKGRMSGKFVTVGGKHPATIRDGGGLEYGCKSLRKGIKRYKRKVAARKTDLTVLERELSGCAKWVRIKGLPYWCSSCL